MSGGDGFYKTPESEDTGQTMEMMEKQRIFLKKLRFLLKLPPTGS